MIAMRQRGKRQPGWCSERMTRQPAPIGKLKKFVSYPKRSSQGITKNEGGPTADTGN